MAVEIERKFLVEGDDWRPGVAEVRQIRQGYLSKAAGLSIRIRLEGAAVATLTIKTAVSGRERSEFEYPIPFADGLALLRQCSGHVIEKARHIVPFGAFKWEIDVFQGANQGLVVAEVELDRPDREFERPHWLGREVTEDRRYYNADLSRNPFSSWRR